MSRQIYQRPRLIPVYKLKISCPACGHKDNCAVSEDRGMVYCRRKPSEHPGCDGGWTHVLNTSTSVSERRPPLTLVKPTPPAPVAGKALVDAAYRDLLQLLPLLPAHTENLMSRGLNASAIDAGKFKSTPTAEEAAEIVRGLSSAYDLSNVPGFFQECGKWMIAHTPAGFFVPVLNRKGQIQGLQIRKDYQQSKRDSRYVWFSSKGKPRGASPGAPAHVQNPERINATGNLIVSEGSLKAFVAAQYLEELEGGLLAFSGVGVFQDSIGEHIRRAWPNLQRISIAFDIDWRVKPQVKQQLFRLMQILRGAGFESVTIRTWEGPEKGLDDYLVAEAREQREVAVA